MLTDILMHINNWFLAPNGAHHGAYTVSDGTFSAPFLHNGQFFRIVGSVFNDGVYQYPASGLTDEEFTGAVWALAVPPSVIALAAEIETWVAANPASALTSESFGGYSYSKGASASGAAAGWKTVFRERLNQWRVL